MGGSHDWMSACMRSACDSVISPIRVKSLAAQASTICASDSSVEVIHAG